jgi:transcriptional regulator with XRE-family HTH domain/KaiC/GvpD/RAD55 family RecA-like ATPase
MTVERKRISTGVGELDPILGGLLIGDNVVWYDDAGSLTAVYTMNFLQASLAQKKYFIYVSFDRSLRNLLGKLGPLVESKSLTILDCFTHGKGKGAEIFRRYYEEMEVPCCVVQVENPADPDNVMAHFNNCHSRMKGDVRFVFESLTGMQELWEGEEQISRFYTHTCPRLYDLNTIGYWIMEKEAHSKRLKATINQIAQVAIELSLKRGKTSLSIVKAENREIESINTPHHYWTRGLNITFDSRQQSAHRIDLGSRIREFRTKRGFSQTELARMVGVTPSNISQIESNQIHPSLPALFKMAESLSVDVSSFFQESPEAVRQVVIRESDGVDVQLPDMPKNSMSAKRMAPLDVSAKAEPYILEIAPRKVLPSHFFIHKGDEVGYLLTGKLQVRIGGNIHAVRSGDVIYLGMEMPSQWENPGPGTARLLWIKIR